MVLAKRAVKSDKRGGLVEKLMNLFTGPCRVNKRIHGSSYKLVHHDTNRPGKRHAAHISPLPKEIILFKPANKSGNSFGQVYAPIQAHTYKDAGIKGFAPTAPFKASHHLSGLSATPLP